MVVGGQSVPWGSMSPRPVPPRSRSPWCRGRAEPTLSQGERDLESWEPIPNQAAKSELSPEPSPVFATKQYRTRPTLILMGKARLKSASEIPASAATEIEVIRLRIKAESDLLQERRVTDYALAESFVRNKHGCVDRQIGTLVCQ